MSKENKLIPELRFPEFVNEGEWKIKPFDELFEIGNGRDYKHLDKGDIPVYGSGGYMLSVNDFLYDGESVCIGRKGTIDKPMFLNGKFWTVDTLFYTHSFKNCLPKYIHYLFQNIDWLKHNEAGGVPSLSKTNINKIETAVPKLPEQQKIASCLSSLDEVIAAHSQKLDLLKDHKKGLMQNLFPQEGEKVPKYRFKEFEKDGEWVEKTLEYLTVKIGDGIHTTPKYDPSGDYFFVNGNNLTEGKIAVDEKTKRVSSEEFEIHKKDLTEKTIFLSINGTIGNLAFYNNEMVVLGKSACYITPSQKLNNVFLYYSLQSPRIINYFFSELTGSTIKNLSLKSIRETLICLPSTQEQQKIASCLSSLDAFITAQAEKIEQLKLHKKGLMQGLFPKINE
jgi:type I restriction enzyme S subunit